MNPILKKLAAPDLTPCKIANLLQKHIGDAPNEVNCKQAFEALHRLKSREFAIPTQVLARLSGNCSNYCVLIEATIQRLRGGQF